MHVQVGGAGGGGGDADRIRRKFEVALMKLELGMNVDEVWAAGRQYGQVAAVRRG